MTGKKMLALFTGVMLGIPLVYLFLWTFWGIQPQNPDGLFMMVWVGMPLLFMVTM